MTLNDFLKHLLLEIEAMLKTCDMKDDQLAAIVLSMPGIISENEIICSRKFPHLKGYKLYEQLSEFFKAKVMIKNDVNAKTLGIHKELPTDAEKIVFISPEPSGVGSGIMLNGSLYEGSCQGAGEIGRMLFQTCDLSSKTSEPQFLENIVSKENIKQFMLEKSEKTEDIKELVNEKGSVDFSKVTVAYEKGNPLAQMTMEMIAKHYALAIHNISVILNPDLVILGGDLIEMGDVILKEINLYLEGVDCLPLKIEFAYGDKDIQLLGTLCFGESYTTKNILTV